MTESKDIAIKINLLAAKNEAFPEGCFAVDDALIADINENLGNEDWDMFDRKELAAVIIATFLDKHEIKIQ